MVRLGAEVAKFDIVKDDNFNSTMVRLGAFAGSVPRARWLFQFHYGTIGGFASLLIVINEYIFQFHYGTIGGKKFIAPYTGIGNFNSTMVRLGVNY